MSEEKVVKYILIGVGATAFSLSVINLARIAKVFYAQAKFEKRRAQSTVSSTQSAAPAAA